MLVQHADNLDTQMKSIPIARQLTEAEDVTLVVIVDNTVCYTIILFIVISQSR